MAKTSSTFRALVLITIGRLLTAVAGIAAVRVSTGLLSPGEFGVLAILTAIQAFFGLLLVNPIGQYVTRHTHQWWDEGRLSRRLIVYIFYVLVVAATAGAVAAWYVSGLTPAGRGAIVMIAVTGTSTCTALVATLNMLGHRMPSILWNAISAFSGLCLAVAAARWDPTAWAWLAGLSAGQLISGIGAFLSIRRAEAERTVHPAQIRDVQPLLRYCLPLALATGLMWLQLNGYRFVVVSYWGGKTLGYLAVGLALASQLWTVAEALLTQLLLPSFFRRLTATGARDALNDLVNVAIPSYSLLLLAVCVGAKAVMVIFLAPGFHDVVPFVLIGSVVEFCRASANILGYGSQATGRTTSLAVPYVLGNLACYSGLLFCVDRHAGMPWVAASLAAGGLVTLGAFALRMRRTLPVSLAARSAVLIMVSLLGCLAGWWWNLSIDTPTAAGALAEIALIGGVTLSALWLTIGRSEAASRLLATPLDMPDSDAHSVEA